MKLKRKMGKENSARAGSKKSRQKASSGRRSKSKKRKTSHHKKNLTVRRKGGSGLFDEFYGSKNKKISVLRHGESMLLAKGASELEIVLYRPLDPPGLHATPVCETPGDDVAMMSPVLTSKKSGGEHLSIECEDNAAIAGKEREGSALSISASSPPFPTKMPPTQFQRQSKKKVSRSTSRAGSEDDAEVNKAGTPAKGKGLKNHRNGRASLLGLPPSSFGISVSTPGTGPGGTGSTAQSPWGIDAGPPASSGEWENQILTKDKEIRGEDGESQLPTSSVTSFVHDLKVHNVPDSGNTTKPASACASHPLFFDTTACVFVDPKNLRKANYIATGRSTTDHKDMIHLPHAVVTGKEPPAPGFYTRLNLNVSQSEPTISERQIELMMSFGALEESDVESWVSSAKPPLTFAPLASVNGAVIMAAADGVRLHLKHLQQAAGALVSCSLFDCNNSPLPPDWGVYFLVRVKGPSPSICLIPVLAFQGKETSQISIMLRRIRVEEEYVWELISMAEFLPCCDVPGVLLSMQKRGLTDVHNYNPDYRSLRQENEGSSEHDSFSEPSETLEERAQEEEDEEEGDRLEPALKSIHELSTTKIGMSASFCGGGSERGTPVASSAGVVSSFPFEELLAKLPLVIREGRRQYSEGFTNVNSMLDEDAFSGEDEVMEDALKAAVPRFAHGHPTRYADGTYNNGSHPAALSSHYTTCRAKYAVEQALVKSSTAKTQDRVSGVNPPLNAEMMRLQRLEDEEEAPLPPPWEAVMRGTPTPVSGSRHSVNSSTASKKSRKKRRSGSSSKRKKKGKKGKKRKSSRRSRSRKRSAQ